jgi:hypothetical protein
MKETIEEVAKRIYGSDASKDVEYYAFILGAKWQAERSYSYDEVRAIAYKAYCIGQLDEPTEGKFNQWIHQFKKA